MMSDTNNVKSVPEGNLAVMITRARLGDRTCMGQLVEAVEPRLQTYIFRLTLNQELAEELCQKTLVKMLQSLETLNHTDRFWCWLFRHGMGEVQHYYRDRKRRHDVEIKALNREYLKQYAARNHNDGFDETARMELSEIMCQAIAELRFSYRNILVLRCYEDLSFAEIALLMNCKELGARVLFFRARNALQQRLARNGFQKETLLAGLALFEILTLSTKASSTAGSVNAASLHVGLVATVVGTLGTRLGLLILTSFSAVLAGIAMRDAIVTIIVVFFFIVVILVASLFNNLG